MIIFICILFVVLLLASTCISLSYVWRRKDFKSLFVQLIIIVFTMAGGIYGITQYPTVTSIARVLNNLSPLK